ncbi:MULTISPECIES: hypothetical protein [Paenibacillus]|jgi:hypothetical protein|uniref:Uncharacterized protein n=1 Tax=Paenibacillus antibioticophila TaxID=1274374 RepID=A0A919XX92_9BACL|nr:MULTISPECIES: hypothetical protein [Paenibacillus]OXL81636.1 hypothetical protein BCV73_00055 [Paenibacillus sp. SSG-1]GIO38178.1 hypothetical protein J41TS12_30390 [Paenibacillus antibioticophila]GJM78164.1 hypothetical protein HMSSN139_06600 [Paenibacillus sp. HMSSN-139]
MKASQDFIKQLELLYEQYEQEVTEKLKAGILKDTTAKTYLTHSSNFVRWCRNDFVPGDRNK